MPNSNNLVIRDLTTGAGRTGLAVKLRHVTDGFATDVYSASELAGKPGVYQFVDVPVNKYKLWVNGSEDKTFGGDNGVWWPTNDLLDYLINNLYLPAEHVNSGVLAEARIPGLPASKITSETFVDARIPNLDAAKIASGVLAEARIPGLPASKITSETFAHARIPYNIDALKLGSGIVGNPNYDKLSGVREYIQVRLDLSPTMNTNMLVVDSTMPSSNIQKFQTIQLAINYAQSLSPSAASPWFIYIMPTNSGGYVENITLQPYVHLIGMGLVYVQGSISGGNYNSLLQNLYFTYHGNNTISNLRAANSLFRVTNDDTGYQLTLSGNILMNCGLMNVAVDNEFNPRIISSGNNVFIKCWSNIRAEIDATDKGSVDSLESYPLNF